MNEVPKLSLMKSFSYLNWDIWGIYFFRPQDIVDLSSLYGVVQVGAWSFTMTLHNLCLDNFVVEDGLLQRKNNFCFLRCLATRGKDRIQLPSRSSQNEMHRFSSIRSWINSYAHAQKIIEKYILPIFVNISFFIISLSSVLFISE